MAVVVVGGRSEGKDEKGKESWEGIVAGLIQSGHGDGEYSVKCALKLLVKM